MPKSLTEHWTDDELAALSPRQPPDVFNPFAEVCDHPVGENSARRWFPMHDGPSGGPAPHYDSSAPYDPLGGLLDALNEAPMHAVTDPKTGEVTAVFPTRNAQPTRHDESEWEQRAQTMHANQRTIELEDTPEAEYVLPPQSGERQKEPPRFEDLSPEERARWNKLTRGD